MHKPVLAGENVHKSAKVHQFLHASLIDLAYLNVCSNLFNAGARCLIGPGRYPSYVKRRKFAHFMAAADRELEQKLLAVLNRAKRA